MIKKLIFCLVVIVVLSFPAYASAPAEKLAAEMLKAAERGQSSLDVTVHSTDLDGVLAEVFALRPELYYYYGGYSSLRYPTYLTATITLRNTRTPVDEVYVIRNASQLKAAIGLGLAKLEDTVHIVTYGMEVVSSETVTEIAQELRQEAYLAYMGYHGNSISYSISECAPVTSYDISFVYWEGVSRETLRQWRTATETRATELCRSLFAQDMPDYLKVLKIHDWLVSNSRYNTRDTSAPQSHMAYSALVSGDPVCQGYTEAAMLLFQAAGIPNTYVEGTGTNSKGKTESHAWNCVQIQGRWYMLDITWDDPTTQDGSDMLRYDYYLVTSNKLAQDHTWNYRSHPDCVSTQGSQLLSSAQADTGHYRDYRTDALVTVAQAQAKYTQLLGGADTPTQTRPKETVPKWTRPTEAEPDRTAPSTFYPDDDDPGFTRPGGSSNAKDKDGFSVGKLLGGLAVLGGIGAGVSQLFRKKKKESRRQPKTFDPNDY